MSDSQNPATHPQPGQMPSSPPPAPPPQAPVAPPAVPQFVSVPVPDPEPLPPAPPNPVPSSLGDGSLSPSPLSQGNQGGSFVIPEIAQAQQYPQPVQGQGMPLPPEGQFSLPSNPTSAPIPAPSYPAPAGAPASFEVQPSSSSSTLPLSPPSSPSPVDNQFIPQGLVSPTLPGGGVAPPGGGDPSSPGGFPSASVPPVITPPKKGGSFLKTMLILLLFFLLLGAGAIGVRFGLSYFNTNVKEVTITYWGLWENDAIVRPIIADFEAQNPKIKVQYMKQNPREYRERLQAAVDRGDGPDVFRFHATWIPMLKNEIEPVPVDIMGPSQFSSQFYKVATQDLLAGSTLWGIPLMVDGLGLYINDELFETAGVTPPTTYEELLSIVPKLTVKNGDDIVTSAIALGTTNNVEHFSDILGLMILQNGGKLTSPTGREAEEALVFYRKFATPLDPLYTWNEFQDNSVSAFANKKVAMMIAPSWRAFDIKAINPNTRFHIVPTPQLPGNTVAWGSYWAEGVSAKSASQAQAFAFLKYLTSREAVTKLYSESAKTRLFGEPYALVELQNTVKDDPYVGAYVSQAQYAQSFPLASKTHDNGINDKMIKYMEDAINATTQHVAISEALGTMSQGFKQILTSYGLTSASP